MGGFEKYVKEKWRSFGTPIATITKQGILILNGLCSEKYIRDRSYAEFYFDAQSRAIGLKFFDDERLEGYRIQKRRDSKMAFISSRGFFRHYGIPFAEKRSFPAEWDEKAQMLIIRLHN